MVQIAVGRVQAPELVLVQLAEVGVVRFEPVVAEDFRRQEAFGRLGTNERAEQKLGI